MTYGGRSDGYTIYFRHSPIVYRRGTRGQEVVRGNYGGICRVYQRLSLPVGQVI